MEKKRKMKVKIVFLATLLVLFSSSCSKKPQEGFPEWQGNVEYRDGVKVIKNPGESLYGHLTLELEMDLSLGGDDDEASLFYRVEDTGVDSQGNIMLSISGITRSKSTAVAGTICRRSGGKGRGPVSLILLMGCSSVLKI